MAGFNDLPIELLDSICKHLRHECGNPEVSIYGAPARKALASLCLTSKKCLRAAQPQLYYGVASDSGKARIDVLATTFLENKHLAQLVRELYLTSDYDIKHSAWLFDHLDAEYRSKKLPLTGSLEDGYYNPDFVTYASRVVDLLLTQVENVRFVEISSAIDEDDSGLDFIAPQHIHNPSFLSMLEELSIRHYDTEGGFLLNWIMPLIFISKVQKLSLWMCIGIGMEDEEAWTFASIRELRISYSGFDADDFRHLVRLCPNLELLAFEMADAIVTQYCDDIATAHEISLALRPLSSTLQTLILTQYGDRSDEDSEVSIASLAGFSKLEHLVISLDHLIDEEEDSDSDDDDVSEEDDAEGNNVQRSKTFLNKLPRSLKSLYIRLPWDDDSISKELCRLASCAKKDLPNMKLLTVDAKLDLKARFKNTGIHYQELIRHPPITDILELEKIAMAC